jgi:hypothetical protein
MNIFWGQGQIWETAEVHRLEVLFGADSEHAATAARKIEG